MQWMYRRSSPVTLMITVPEVGCTDCGRLTEIDVLDSSTDLISSTAVAMSGESSSLLDAGTDPNKPNHESGGGCEGGFAFRRVAAVRRQSNPSLPMGE